MIRYGMVYLLITISEVMWIILEWQKNNLRLQYGVKIVAVFVGTYTEHIYLQLG